MNKKEMTKQKLLLHRCIVILKCIGDQWILKSEVRTINLLQDFLICTHWITKIHLVYNEFIFFFDWLL